MSFHVELRCEGVTAPRQNRQPPGHTRRGCATVRLLHPQGEARTQTGAGIAVALLVAEALGAGWRHSADGWRCPFCFTKARAKPVRTAPAPPRPRQPLPRRSAGE